jgi:hypothetical protein
MQINCCRLALNILDSHTVLVKLLEEKVVLDNLRMNDITYSLQISFMCSNRRQLFCIKKEHNT